MCAWFILARSLKTSPSWTVPPNSFYQEGSVNLLTGVKGILNPAQPRPKLTFILSKHWTRKCNWWQPRVETLLVGRALTTIGIWLQSLFQQKRETCGVWGASQGGEDSPRGWHGWPYSPLDSVKKRKLAFEAVTAPSPPEGHISCLFRTTCIDAENIPGKARGILWYWSEKAHRQIPK